MQQFCSFIFFLLDMDKAVLRCKRNNFEFKLNSKGDASYLQLW